MILPAVARPSTGLTPVSMTATSTPAPVYPAAHQARIPVYVVVLYMELKSVTGSYAPAAGAAEACHIKPTPSECDADAVPGSRAVLGVEPEDPWLCVPASRRVCRTSDRSRGRRSSLPHVPQRLGAGGRGGRPTMVAVRSAGHST